VINFNTWQKLSKKDVKLCGSFCNKTIKMLKLKDWAYACLRLSQFNCRMFSAECVKGDVESKIIKNKKDGDTNKKMLKGT
jgi:hypothetical protein